jgi:hypothetical protein
MTISAAKAKKLLSQVTYQNGEVRRKADGAIDMFKDVVGVCCADLVTQLELVMLKADQHPNCQTGMASITKEHIAESFVSCLCGGEKDEV